MNNEDKRKKIVAIARENLGKCYKYGAKAEEAPEVFDCSSFTKYLYKEIGIEIPRTALDQASCGKEIGKNDNLKIGDLIFIKGGWGHYNPDFPEGIGHVGIFVGDSKVISARWSKNDGNVIEETINDYLTRDDFRTIKRIL